MGTLISESLVNETIYLLIPGWIILYNHCRCYVKAKQAFSNKRTRGTSEQNVFPFIMIIEQLSKP